MQNEKEKGTHANNSQSAQDRRHKSVNHMIPRTREKRTTVEKLNRHRYLTGGFLCGLITGLLILAMILIGGSYA